MHTYKSTHVGATVGAGAFNEAIGKEPIPRSVKARFLSLRIRTCYSLRRTFAPSLTSPGNHFSLNSYTSFGRSCYDVRGQRQQNELVTSLLGTKRSRSTAEMIETVHLISRGQNAGQVEPYLSSNHLYVSTCRALYLSHRARGVRPSLRA